MSKKFDKEVVKVMDKISTVFVQIHNGQLMLLMKLDSLDGRLKKLEGKRFLRMGEKK